MQVYTNVKRFYSSLQDRVGFRRRKNLKRQLQISPPFGFKKEVTILPGFTEDEIMVLREKAAASRIGIADPLFPSSCDSPSDYMHPRHPRPIPLRAASHRRSGSGSFVGAGMTGAGSGAFETQLLLLSSSLPLLPTFTGGSDSSNSSSTGPVDLDSFMLGSPVSQLSVRRPVSSSPHRGSVSPVSTRSVRTTRSTRSRSA